MVLDFKGAVSQNVLSFGAVGNHDCPPGDNVACSFSVMSALRMCSGCRARLTVLCKILPFPSMLGPRRCKQSTGQTFQTVSQTWSDMIPTIAGERRLYCLYSSPEGDVTPHLLYLLMYFVNTSLSETTIHSDRQFIQNINLAQKWGHFYWSITYLLN